MKCHYTAVKILLSIMKSCHTYCDALKDDRTLLELVKKFPFVYDSTDPRFKMKHEKCIAWRQIGKAVNLTGRECETRFINLRNKYCKERKPLLLQGTSLGEYKGQWKLFDEMRFLDPYIKVRSLIPTDPLQDPLQITNESDFPVEPKAEFHFTLASSDNASTPFLEQNNHTSNAEPTITIVPESVRSEPPSTDHINQLIGTMQNIDDFIKNQQLEQSIPANDDQFLAFGRTIAYMLTGIKDRKRQRKAMAELLMKMSEYDSEND